ncbi:hypothetical protein [Bacillus phage PK16]|nr:hypothetical protein [Bacillus phage PK16]AUM58964.1 hypothetical protein BCP01_163 [Bacillus phage BCP01]UJH95673.1 hypothetical protein [Bacillus phage vB_BtM_BMBsp2]
MQNKSPNYIVWDVNEISQVCSPEEMATLNNIIDRVLQARANAGLSNDVRYIVISNDKPYYEPISKMLGLIQSSNKQGYMRGYNDAN